MKGGFSYVYLVKDEGAGPSLQSSDGTNSGTKSNSSSSSDPLMVLKVTSIHSRHQREVAEKEAKLLSRLSHPSIVKMYDATYRTVSPAHSGKRVNLGKEKDGTDASKKERPQHVILMEYCEGGHALDVCTTLKSQGKRFDISSLIIAFGQICNAVSYLHAQRPPIVHRDLKPVNFLVKNGAYKLCDFGSAVFGHIDLKTPSQRAEAQEVIEKTTTQMFRAPEMVDLYMTKKLTQRCVVSLLCIFGSSCFVYKHASYLNTTDLASHCYRSTDVWALGCCLYSLAFLQNCFEENSNLAILSRKYKIPEENPYGESLVELIDRMLTVDAKARADMTEVILCLSAIYSNRPLPPRKKVPKSPKKVESEGEPSGDAEKRERVGSYRTDGQGIRTSKVMEPKKPAEAKKLNPNSAAARRRRACQTSEISPRESQASNRLPSLASSKNPEFENSFPSEVFGKKSGSFDDDLAFSTTENPFASAKGDGKWM